MKENRKLKTHDAGRRVDDMPADGSARSAGSWCRRHSSAGGFRACEQDAVRAEFLTHRAGTAHAAGYGRTTAVAGPYMPGCSQRWKPTASASAMDLRRRLQTGTQTLTRFRE